MKNFLRLTTSLILLIFIGGNAWGQIISQYIETSSGTTPKGIEIWNNTGASLDFSTNNLVIEKGNNGGVPSVDFTLSNGTLASGAVIVIGTSDMGTTTTGNGSVFHEKAFTFNGDDALVVKYGGTTTDMFGLAGNDPGSAWTGNDVSTANQNIQLVSGITAGDTDGWTDPSTRFETICTDNCLTGFGVAPSAGATPSISVFPSTLTGFTYIEGSGPSAEQSFTVEGSNLTHDISIAATTNYEISTGTGVTFVATNPITLSQSSGTVSSTTIYVRLKAGLGVGSYNNEDITASSTDATSKTVTCSGSVTSVGGCATDLIISEYVEGSGNNKYLEIANFTGSDVMLSNYKLKTYSGGATTPNYTYDFPAQNLADKSVFVVGDPNGTIYSPDATSTVCYYNGDDAVALTKANGAFVDIIGRIGEDPGDAWTSGSISTKDQTLVRKASVTSGVSTNPANGFPSLGTEWDSYAQDYEELGSHTMDCGGSGPVVPTAFSATANGQSQIDLSWTENTAGNDVLIAWNSTNTFGTPVDGTAYAASASIPGGGTSLGTDADGAFSHTGLSSNTQYFYKIWSVDGSTNYSSGVEANAATAAAEPTNHPSSFGATANSSSAITVNWTDATPAADGYLIKGSSVGYGDIAVPVDGTAETNSLLVQNVAAGVETFQFTSLTASTTYYFKIYPYNGSSAAINYKIDGTVPETSATTDAATAYDNVETFDNFGATGNSYSSGTFEGQDGSTWTYTEARGDVEITGKALMVGRNRTPQSEVYSGTLGGGIQVLNFDYMQAFGTNVNLNVLVNDVVVGNVTSTSELELVKNSGDITVNISGNFVLKFKNVNNSNGQVVIDNISWNSISAFSAYNGTGNWTNTSNWSNGLPTGTTDVIINGNVTVDDVVECNHMTISPLGAVKVDAGQGLSVNGNLLIESTGTGTGSFIGAADDYDITGTQTVQRFISGAAEAWHLLSSPVAAQSISGDFTPSGTYGDGSGYDFYAWDEPTETWLNQKVGANNLTAFTPAQGYLVAYQAINPTKTFTGTLNEGIYYPTLTISGTQSYQHSNLLGNPYPSSIDWKNVSGLDKSKLVADGGGYNMYIWNEASVNYGVYNDANSGDAGTNGTSRYIAPMQGFFVIAANAGDFGFDNDARVHSTQAWLKSGNDNSFRLSVTAPANTGKDEILLDFGHEASQGGADKWYSMSATAPALYATTVERDYSIRFLTSIADNPLVHVAFKAGIDGEYSIQADFNTAELPSVKLIDHLTGIVHDLISNPTYNFAAATGDDPNRFELKFGAVGIDDNVALEQTSIYSHGQSVYISSTKSANALINIYNVTGQQVYANTMVIDGQKQIALNTPTGWYIVKVTTAAGVATQKVFIKSN